MKITKAKLATLTTGDPVLGAIIRATPDINIPKRQSNHLKSAAKIIVDQQLSVKAARSIWQRIDQLVGEWSPHRLHQIEIAQLRAAGISMRKADYIKTLAADLHRDAFSFKALSDYDDEQAKQALIKIKGFGVWSAEMYLIFTLGRENIFAVDDAGLKNAVIKHYDLDETSYRENIQRISARWEPYKSIASLYLWASLKNQN